MTVDSMIGLAGLLFLLITSCFGALIWFVRLEGKVETLKALHEQHKEMTDKRHDNLGDRMDSMAREIRTDLGKIFDRIDGKQDKVR